MFPSSAAPSLRVEADSADTVGVSSPEARGKEWTQSEIFALVDERMEMEADEPFLEMLSRQLKELGYLQDKNGSHATGPFSTASQPTTSRTNFDDILSGHKYSSNSSDKDLQEPVKRKRKRSSSKKPSRLLENLMKQMMERQEAMHRQLMEELEKRENNRVFREEAIISSIKNISGQQIPIPEPVNIPPTAVDQNDNVSVEEYRFDPGDKRWLSSEVQTLIRLRIAREHKFQKAGHKVLLWEEISKAMSSLGYTRSGKKCREKWHNIKGYFKKAKHQPKDSKRCPYFHEVELFFNQKKHNDEGRCKDSSDRVGMSEAVNSVASSSTS